ncbi:MAG: hypothetical protein AAGE03_05655 [Pseudomonadota bacterium]
MSLLFHGLLTIILTLLTQIGGLCWLAALPFRHRVPVFLGLYVAASLAAIWIAPMTGRGLVACGNEGALRSASWVHCALNRSYATPEMAAVLDDLAVDMDARFPGTQTLLLDANFPFLTGFPLLPHLSHDDGEKADIAFYYAGPDGYMPGRLRSPIGYFAFQPGPSDCQPRRLTLRWDLTWLQPLWPDHDLDQDRTATALRTLIADPRVDRLFIEPHLRNSLGVMDPKLRFQGCRAARHDDHIHLQL